MKKHLILLLGVFSFVLSACGKTQTEHTINLDHQSLQLQVGQSQTLNVTITPNDLENPKLVWTSDPAIALVEDGVVSAVSEGTSDIKVYLDLNKNALQDAGEPSDVCVLVVRQPDVETIPVESLNISQTSLSLELNEEKTLSATVLPANATVKTITWLSNNAAVAQVNNGKVIALNSGSAIITAYVDENLNGQRDDYEKYTTCAVTVLGTNPDPTIWVSSVKINTNGISIEEESFDMVYATVLPNNATFKTITWFSSDSSIATVSGGRISGLKVGSVIVTAYVDENGNASLDSAEQRDTVNVTITEKIVDPKPDDDPIPARGENLPIGNTSVSGPSNTTPVDIAEWVNYDFSTTLPPHWSFIMGNNKKTTSSDFYAVSSNGGGFKFSKTTYGLQSPLLNSWLKTEVRLEVNQVHNNSQNVNQHKGKPIFHIYSYDKNGYYLGMDTYDQQNSFQSPKTIKFYLTNPDMAYFEIRLNAHPYKGSQCYNFGVNQISLKGWPYGA